ncbi:hypothetical protein ACFFGT_26365 [Mucilaginibacter angelicae]|uniref:Secretion system C-terminal sorting domain-containing protein n=1 Tax=Mucilaginibacter angelicae TaxID=869718 RepID=A0ABV6LE53_9SPHI
MRLRSILHIQNKKILLLWINLFFCASHAFAATFDWNGLTSAVWTDKSNWTVGGFIATEYPGQNRNTDVVQFGVTALSIYLNQPTLTLTANQTLTVASITFGPREYSISSSITGTTLTVNGSTGKLIVTGDIVQTPNTTNGITTTVNNFINGTASVQCANIRVGTSGTTGGQNSFLFSHVANLYVTNNVNLIPSTNLGNGSGFRLEDGIMKIDGQINITNPNGYTSGSNLVYFTVNGTYNISSPKSNPSLYLTNANAIASISPPYGSVNFDGNRQGGTAGGRTTIHYTGSNPTIYTSSFVGFGSGGGFYNAGPTYDNLVIEGTGTATIGTSGATNPSTLVIDSAFTTTSNVTFATYSTAITVGTDWTNSAAITGGAGTTDINRDLTNSGTMTMGTGAVTIARNYTNTGTFTPNASALISFDGTTQTLTDATATGTNFYNVTFTGGGTKSMASGSKFTVAAPYTLNVNSASTLAVGNATSTTTALTILSTSAGDASIGTLAAGTITGSINVQRYVKGTLRRYMLMSSPVINSTSTFFTTGSLPTYNLVPLKATTYITGPSGSTNGFDDATATGNSPSVFVYDENAPASSNVNLVLNNEYKPFNSTSEGLPAANGFLYYFRGSRSVSNPFVRPFPATDNATLNFFGTVIKGAVGANAQFSANIVNFQASPPLYYTAAVVSAPATLSFSASTPAIKKGLNLIGNPYASVIDLHALYLANTTNKFYYMLIKDASTGTNSSSTKFAMYDASNGATGSAGTGASRYALSGQGFFTLATSASAIKFDESMKVAYSNYSPPTPPVFNVVGNPGKNIAASYAASAGSNDVGDILPRLTMELVQDTVVHNSTDINFDENASAKFVHGEDAPYYQPSGQGDLFYSLSSDSVGCFANYTGNLEKLKRVNLIVTFSNYGVYKLTSPIKKNIDARYSIYLKDKYTNDSLDVVHNAEYAFKVESNPASYAHDRFYLSIGIVPGHDYRLLTFTGKKVIEGITLNWETNNESNFTGFSVQKSADGGKTFLTIDSLRSTGAGKYSYTDPTPGSGQIIYRLSQNLVTGENKLSDNLKFEIQPGTGVNKFLVYPTVVSVNTVNIKLQQTSASPVRISIVNPSGVIVKKLSATGTNTIQENVAGLSRGLYIVVAVNESTGDRIGSGMFFKQ